MKRKQVYFAIVFIFICIFMCSNLFRPSPIKAYEHFSSSNYLAEDQLIDPLILAGDRVVPIVLKHLPDPNMPRRRYAIHFLGNGEYRTAIPYLSAILENPRESDYYRGDALEAITIIDSEKGKVLAEKYIEEGYLGRIAVEIVNNNFEPIRRTYWQALLGSHD